MGKFWKTLGKIVAIIVAMTDENLEDIFDLPSLERIDKVLGGSNPNLIVYLHDLEKEDYKEIKDYCYLHDLSLSDSAWTECADFSYHYDTIAYFAFETERDALIFLLRWKQSS